VAGAGAGGAKGRGEGELRDILVPVDFSDCGLAPIPHAYALVAPGGCVHLLHVVERDDVPNPLYAHYSPGHVPTTEQRLRQEAELRDRLLALAPASAGERGVRTSAHVVEADDVAALVCAAAGQVDADAICLGTHGRGGLARALLGSVAERVLADTERLVLLVRPAVA
jgi:nucleotide-binding universal stress UspA family protein